MQKDQSPRKLAPVALFVYNRVENLRHTLEALKNNCGANEFELFIFSDGPATSADVCAVEKVRHYIREQATGFKQVHIVEQPVNIGLQKSIVSGVDQLCEEFGQVIVLEDDIVTSPFFLKFMNDGLACYRDVAEVFSICAYLYPIHLKPEQRRETVFLDGMNCWGWATWADRWKRFNPNATELIPESVK